MTLDKRIKNLIFEKTLSGHLDSRGFHLDYEGGIYRQEELAKIIRDTIEHYALTPQELAKFSSSKEFGEMRKHAWKRISDAHKNAKGDYGELILYILLKYFYKIDKFTTKVRLRSSSGEQIKGFDCAHFSLENGEIKLWLGEGKLRDTLSSCLADAIESIETLTKISKIKAELSILSSEIELRRGSVSRRKIEEAICEGKSVSKLKIIIPVMLCYSLKKLGEYSEITDEFNRFLDDHFNKKLDLIRGKKINSGVKCEIVFYLFPIEDMKTFKDKLEQIEEANR
jgi:hypothetical protein